MDAINNVLEIKSIFLILFVYLFSVILENTWIPKSTERPINKTAKAHEIKLRIQLK